MRPAIVTAILLLLGCDGSHWDSSSFPGAPISIAAPADRYEDWRATVEQVTTLWAVAVEPYGCAPPFRWSENRGEDTYVIKLTPVGDWDHPDYVGLCWTDRIEVKDNSFRAVTLAHELGHAMGLDHHSGSAESIMDNTSAFRVITAEDGAAAACALGCSEKCSVLKTY